MSDAIISKKVDQLGKAINKTQNIQRQVFSFKESAKYLKIEKSNLSGLIEKKQISYLHIKNGKMFFSRIELDKWLRKKGETRPITLLKAITRFFIKAFIGFLLAHAE